MKLIIVMPQGSPWSRNFALQVSKLGHQVVVVDLTPKNEVSYLSSYDSFQLNSIEDFKRRIYVYENTGSVKESLTWVINGVKLIRKAAKSFKPDLIISLYGGLWGFVSWISAVKPLIIYVVGSDILYGGVIKKFITKRVLSSSAIIFSNGNYLGEQARILAPNVNLKKLYLGINTDKFTPLREKPSTPVNIICTRGFAKVYNNKYLIDGLNELNLSLLPDFRVIFTSSGNLLDEVKEYAQSILSDHVKDRVKFLGGIDDECLLRHLREAHIYVSLSLSDGASISLMEALSCELFPILSDIPANREWINNNNGILVPLDNPKHLAGAIIKAVIDEKWRLNAGKYNRGQIIDKANIKTNTEHFINIVMNNMSLP